MSVAHISSKQYMNTYHDTPDKKSRKVLLSSPFGNKETRIKKLNPSVVYSINMY